MAFKRKVPPAWGPGRPAYDPYGAGAAQPQRGAPEPQWGVTPQRGVAPKVPPQWVPPPKVSAWRSLIQQKKAEEGDKEDAGEEPREEAEEPLEPEAPAGSEEEGDGEPPPDEGEAPEGEDEALEDPLVDDAPEEEPDRDRELEEERRQLENRTAALRRRMEERPGGVDLEGSVQDLIANAERAATANVQSQQPPAEAPTLEAFDAGTWVSVNGRRFVGYLKTQRGAQKFYVACEETAKVFNGQDVKITWKSNPPAELRVGDWIEFSVVEEYPGEWGSPLAIDIVIMNRVGGRVNLAFGRSAAPPKVATAPAGADRWSGPRLGPPATVVAARSSSGPRAAPHLAAPPAPAAAPPAVAPPAAPHPRWRESAPAAARPSLRPSAAPSTRPLGGRAKLGRREPEARPLPHPPLGPPPGFLSRAGSRAGGLLKTLQRNSPSVPRARGRGSRKKPFERVFLEAPKGLTEADRTALMKMRAELELTVEGDARCGFPPLVQFDELEGVLPDFTMKGLQACGADNPSPLQAQALPLVLSGRDLIGIANTGSGKTLAYLLPAIVHIEAQEPLERQAATPIALVLVPTREAAMQVTAEAQKLLRDSKMGRHSPLGIGVKSVYDNARAWQVEALRKGCHIVAATPGRLLELVDEREISLERVTYFVLDEVDNLLDSGCEEQICAISAQIRPDRHVLIFSESWPEHVQDLAERVCNPKEPPVTVTHGQNALGDKARSDVVHEVIVIDDKDWEERDMRKQGLLFDHVREALLDEGHKVLAFVSNKRLAESLCTSFSDEGFRTESIHGGRGQERRLDILAQFQRGELHLLATTDPTTSGQELPGVSHVIMYDMGEIEEYLQQRGRASPGPYGSGRTLLFFEYNRKQPHLAGRLIEALEQTGQEVPEELREIAHEAVNGLREAKWGAHCA